MPRPPDKFPRQRSARTPSLPPSPGNGPDDGAEPPPHTITVAKIGMLGAVLAAAIGAVALILTSSEKAARTVKDNSGTVTQGDHSPVITQYGAPQKDIDEIKKATEKAERIAEEQRKEQDRARWHAEQNHLLGLVNTAADGLLAKLDESTFSEKAKLMSRLKDAIGSKSEEPAGKMLRRCREAILEARKDALQFRAFLESQGSNVIIEEKSHPVAIQEDASEVQWALIDEVLERTCDPGYGLSRKADCVLAFDLTDSYLSLEEKSFRAAINTWRQTMIDLVRRRGPVK